jgi:hypothetical protein
VGTLLNLGDCRERLGQLASAWAAFRKAESLAKHTAGDDKRRLEAERRAARLEPQLAKLMITVQAPVDGLVVSRNGQPVDPSLWNTAVPVDPGKYAIVVDAPGYQSWKTERDVTGGATHTIAVPALSHEPVTAAPTRLPPVEASVTEPPPSPKPAPAPIDYRNYDVPQPSAWTPTREVAAVLGIAGVAAAGGGVYFGVHARDLAAKSDAICPTAVCSDPTALSENRQAVDAATRANILYATAGVALAGATVLWFVGTPNSTVIAPEVGHDHAGAVLSGRF